MKSSINFSFCLTALLYLSIVTASPHPLPERFARQDSSCLTDGQSCAVIGYGINMTTGTCCPPLTCTGSPSLVSEIRVCVSFNLLERGPSLVMDADLRRTRPNRQRGLGEYLLNRCRSPLKFSRITRSLLVAKLGFER